MPPKRKYNASVGKMSVGTSASKRKRKAIVKIHPLYQFKAIVRLVISNMIWLADTTHRELGTNPEVNAYIIAHRRVKKQILQLPDKICLKQPPDRRNPEDIDLINSKLRIFKSFQAYPEDLRRSLISRATFNAWPKGRVLVRQGHRANYVYFITEGIVDSDQEYSDPLFPGEIQHNIDQYREGDNFGSLAIFYNEPHYSTVTVASDQVEVLMLNKEDFVSLLETTVHKQWNEVRWALGKFPQFNKFPESAIRAICSFSNLITYRPNTIIPLKDNTGTEIATFVVDGTLQVVQILLIQEDKTKTTIRQRYRLYLQQNHPLDESLPPNVKQFFMQTCTLKRRCVFGLGDQMSKNTVICENEVLALIIPRFVLNRYNPANIWERVVGILDMTYPSLDDIYNSFIEGKRWFQYKKKQTKNISSKKKNPQMSMHDVPLLIRARHLRIRGKLYDKVTSMPLYKFGELDVETATMQIKEFRDRIRNKQAEKDQEQKENFYKERELIRERFQALKREGGLAEAKKALEECRTMDSIVENALAIINELNTKTGTTGSISKIGKF
ncbi:uncharacterized protein LOC106665755 [Cimex lectularius]|uniref:Cyclic nucleotide-binding domain-containing protein n=1 Tax=Cimex lectularius TaxID=79782 RepID=A0A8I6RM31_CIMLE|nr:uncharacterized protein LOC106665755 [Cimex lectularius]